MDDLEYTEFIDCPCRVCGSVEYRYYGGGYNCREGHRNDELREQLADEDDFDFSRSQMRSTQLSMSKMTSQTARVAGKKFRKSSGKGNHDVNFRYGINLEEQTKLFEEERIRFVRRGDKKKHVIMEAAMQILILQIESIKSNIYFNFLWNNNNNNLNGESKKIEFENLARKLFQAYANELSFQYSHTDSFHPELTNLAPDFKASKHFKKRKQKQQQISMSLNKAISQLEFNDELDKELLLDDYDYGNESSLSDSDEDLMIESRATVHKVEQGGLLNLKSNNTTCNIQLSKDDSVVKAVKFPGKKSKPLGNPFSYLNMTFLVYLALIHTGVPFLFSDLARGLELGILPGYRPDFVLSKDIVTVRFNINELRAFHTRFLPNTTQLYYDLRLMLELLARQCKVPDWELSEEVVDGLIFRLINEMALPVQYFLFIKSHVGRLGPLKFSVLNFEDGLFVSPCALIAGCVLFFLRLVYTLTEVDHDDDVNDVFSINERLKSQGLPTQDDLIKIWHKKLEENVLYSEENEHVPVVEPEDFANLLAIANDLLAPTCIIDNKTSIKGIFGSERFEEVTGNPLKIFKKMPSTSYDDCVINLPKDNFKKYFRYPQITNPLNLPNPHKLALRVIKKIIGVSPEDVEKIIFKIIEPSTESKLKLNTIVERDRVVDYSKKKGRKKEKVDKYKLGSEVFVFY